MGRAEASAALSAWWRDVASADRVLAVVAPAGMGKSALVARLLPGCSGTGPLVWSFAEADDAEDFVEAAVAALCGLEARGPEAWAAVLAALRDGPPRVLVLDDLDRALDAGAPALGALVEEVAAGRLGGARLLVTGRWLPERLADREGRGLRTLALAELSTEEARLLLRRWRVRGRPEALDGLSARVGRDPRSLTLLGMTVGWLGDGDARKASAWLRAEASPLVERLAGRLRGEERQLLGWLCAARCALAPDLLEGLALRGGREVAGPLAGVPRAALLDHLGRLERLGVVARDAAGHPQIPGALRPGLLRGSGVPLVGVNAALRAELQRRGPGAGASLDGGEALIAVTCAAGDLPAASALYHSDLGGWMRLASELGEYARGRRILDGILAVGEGRGERGPAGSGLLDAEWGLLRSERALIAGSLGALRAAEVEHLGVAALSAQQGDAAGRAADLLSVAEVCALRGRLPRAEAAAREALSLLEPAGGPIERESAQLGLAHVLDLLGRPDEALDHVRAATRRDPRSPPVGQLGVWPAGLFLRLGDAARARAWATANRETCLEHGWLDDVAHNDALLARVALADGASEPRAHLDDLRGFTRRTGHVALGLEALALSAHLALAEGDPGRALREARDGALLADAWEHGLLAIALRLTAAEAALALGDPGSALALGVEALERSAHPDCGFAWGVADAAHLGGLAQAALGAPGAARVHLERARALRDPLGHPGLGETLAALGALADLPG